MGPSRADKAVRVAPVYDTIKRVEDGVVVETLDRDRLRWPLEYEEQPPEWFVGARIIE